MKKKKEVKKSEKPKMGRPSKYNEETINRICDGLRLGLFRDQACMLAGINRDTFYEWLNKYPDFSDKVEKAEIACEGKHLANIARFAESDPKQSQWILSKRFYKRWGETSKVDITSNEQTINQPIVILPAKEILNDD